MAGAAEATALRPPLVRREMESTYPTGDDAFTPGTHRTKAERRATRQIVKEMERLEKLQRATSHEKKRQVEALLRAEVRRKRNLNDEMRRHVKRLDERQRLRAKALMQAEKDQEKALAEMERAQNKEMRGKIKEIERMQRETSKKVGMDKKRAERDLNEERVKLQLFEEDNQRALEGQARDLEDARRRFITQQQRALEEQHERERALNLGQYDSVKYKAEAARKAQRKEQERHQDEFNVRTKEISRNWKLQVQQERRIKQAQQNRANNETAGGGA